MVQKVRIMSDEEYREEQSRTALIGLMFVLWGVAYYLDHAFLEPFIEWLREGGWPIWWLWLLEVCMSLPSYIFSDERLPEIIRDMDLYGSTPFQFLSFILKGIGLIVFITYPASLALVAMLTLLFAAVAGVQVLVGMMGWILTCILIFVVLCILGKFHQDTSENS